MLVALYRPLAIIVLVLAMAVAALLGTAQRYLEAPIELSDNSVVWTINSGGTLNKVNRQLYNQGVVNHPRLMALYGRFTGQTHIRAGQYNIESGDTAKSLLDRFIRGEVISYQITFPEGWAFDQWLQHLAKVEQFASISQLSSSQVMEAAGMDKQHPEGWLFPDTYSYISTDTALDILARAHQKMLMVLDSAWQQRSPDTPYNSPYEALIMASIVEKETGLAEERPTIAGVFVRRLNRGMRLQTDPTVIYGLGDAYRGNLKRVHLKTYSPYNTYMIKGLPPTPIAMPSAAAIEAALHPADGTSLYFVARGDGGHYFSDSLEEHQKAVRQYQIFRRAENYQSAPRVDDEKSSPSNNQQQ